MLKNKIKYIQKFKPSKFCAAALNVLLCCAFMSACDTENGKIENFNLSVSPKPAESIGIFASETYLNGNNISGLTMEKALELADKLTLEASENYECIINYDNTGYRLTKADLEIKSNAEELLPLAVNKGAGNYELKFAPVDTPKLRKALKDIADKSEKPPAAPDFAVNIRDSYKNAPRFIPINEKDGARLDIGGTAERITAGERIFEAPSEAVKYKGPISAEFPELLASFATSFNAKGLNSKGRVHNLKKAAKLTNGSIVSPGKRFSCNKTLGKRSKKRGWALAPAFSNGGTETVNMYGGGICQISTTIYNAALKADLKIISRRGHTKKVRYIEGGLDAAISGDNVDLIWENNTLGNVYVFIWINGSDNSLRCELYGKKSVADYDEIIIESEFVKTIPPTEPKFLPDKNLKPGECVLKTKAAAGRIYRAYKLYLRNGKIIRKKLIDETQYLMRPAVYSIGQP